MTEIKGWLTPEIAKAMRDLIWMTKPDVVVEIGVFYGKSLINSAEQLRENGRGVIYGIDPWRHKEAVKGLGSNDNPNYWDDVDLDAVHRDCMSAIWDRGLEGHAVIIRATSRDARFLFGRGIRPGWTHYHCIDILYIDGGHSEEASTLDVSLYGQKVRSGGHIWFDDADWASTRRAVEMLQERCELVKDYGNCHLYKKP